MFSKIKSVGLVGLDSYMIDTEANISSGKFSMEIVGLPDTAVNEAKERVLAAMHNSGFDMPLSCHYTFNLAPANIRKEGSLYDLPIAVAVLSATRQIHGDYKKAAFVGELSLSGEVKAIKGVLPMVLASREHGVKEIYVPFDNCGEAAIIDGINVYGVQSLSQLVKHINDEEKIVPVEKSLFRRPPCLPFCPTLAKSRGSFRQSALSKLPLRAGTTSL